MMTLPVNPLIASAVLVGVFIVGYFTCALMVRQRKADLESLLIQFAIDKNWRVTPDASGELRHTWIGKCNPVEYAKTVLEG